MSDDIWAEQVDRFVEAHYASRRGRVRTHLIDRHLAEFLPPAPVPILDVGGGAGTQSLPLARKGYPVTILDSSPAMLQRARETFDEAALEVRLVEGRAERALTLLEPASFDAVLCHGVIMYFDDPEPLLASLAGLVSPGGIVSIVAKSRDMLAVPSALDEDWEAALAAFDSDRQINRLGLETRADTVEDLSERLRAHEVEPVAWFGVRLFTDWMRSDDEGELDPRMLEVEFRASKEDPYRRMSRLFHLIGRKA